MTASLPFRYRRRVQFAETDMIGIVHFSVFLRYMEEAEHTLWRAAGLTIARPGDETGWPRLAATVDFKSPLRFEEEFDVHLRIVEKTSKTMRYSAELRKEGALLAEGSLTIICIRRKRGEPIKAIDIPPDISSRFEVALGQSG